MTERRAHLWLASGVLGLCLGAAAAVWDAVSLAVVAGACALVAGVAAFRLVGLVAASRDEISSLSSQVSELSESVERESEARVRAQADLEAAAYAAAIERTAVRREPDPDALTDEATGLFSESYFLVATESRVTAARRHLRPVAVVLLEVVEGLGTDQPRPAEPCQVAHWIGETLRESDTACRLEGRGFGLLLEDTPEDGAIWTVERLRRHMVAQQPGLSVWAGVACYPAHGFSTDELLDRAEAALSQAKEWRQDRIEVATAES